MEVFHGFTPSENMESFETLDPLFNPFVTSKKDPSVTDLLSMAVASGLSSDVEGFDFSASMRADVKFEVGPQEVPDSGLAQPWMDSYAPISSFVPDYQQVPPPDPQPVQMANQEYSFVMTPESLSVSSDPGSPQSFGSYEQNQLDNFLEMFENPNCPPIDYQAHPTTRQERGYYQEPQQPAREPYSSSMLKGLLQKPPVTSPSAGSSSTSTSLHGKTNVPSACDINSIQDLEQFLVTPLPISMPSGATRGRNGVKGLKDKRVRKKVQNKTAASRYRQKKRIEKEFLEEQQANLEAENADLRSKADHLEKEISYLKGLLAEVHSRKHKHTGNTF